MVNVQTDASLGSTVFATHGVKAQSASQDRGPTFDPRASGRVAKYLLGPRRRPDRARIQVRYKITSPRLVSDLCCSFVSFLLLLCLKASKDSGFK